MSEVKASYIGAGAAIAAALIGMAGALAGPCSNTESIKESASSSKPISGPRGPSTLPQSTFRSDNLICSMIALAAQSVSTNFEPLREKKVETSQPEAKVWRSALRPFEMECSVHTPAGKQNPRGGAGISCLSYFPVGSADAVALYETLVREVEACLGRTSVPIEASWRGRVVPLSFGDGRVGNVSVSTKTSESVVVEFGIVAP